MLTYRNRLYYKLLNKKPSIAGAAFGIINCYIIFRFIRYKTEFCYTMNKKCYSETQGMQCLEKKELKQYWD